MRLNRIYLILPALLCACSGNKTGQLSNTSSYACGLNAGHYEARLESDEKVKTLILSQHSPGDSPLQNPSQINLADLFGDGQAELHFRSMGKVDGFYQSWELTNALSGERKTDPNQLMASRTGLKHVRVQVVRLAFSRDATPTSTQAATDHDHTHDDHEEHEEHHEHGEGALENADAAHPTYVWFGIYEQQRGKKKPVWCMVSAPVKLTINGQEAEFEILKATVQNVTSGEDATHDSHHH